MTEPKDVQLARIVTEILSGDSTEKADDAYSMAKTIVDAHEANIEAGRKQDEERQRAIDETARRWPELAAEGWRYSATEYEYGMDHDRRECASLKVGDGRIWISGWENGGETDADVLLALIDAAGRNTTAERLRKAIADALECIDGGVYTAAEIVLKEATEASNG